MSRITQFICVLLLAAGVVAPVRAQDTAVSVVDFYNLSQDKQWEWLSRGMADMLITDLSSAEHLQVVDREGLQQYLDEFELQGGGLLNDQTLIDIGKLAGVDKVIFGTFRVDSTDNIVIQATVVDISSRNAETVVKVSGAVEDVLDLEKDLARRLIRDFGVPLSDREKRNLAFAWTESLDATAHFYTALGHYVEAGETRWVFHPAIAWASGDYVIRVDSALEDLAGNAIHHLFEEGPETKGEPEATSKAASAGAREVKTVPFHIP